MSTVDDERVREAGRAISMRSPSTRRTAAAGAGFVELQSTLLFAVLGQRTDAPQQGPAAR